MLEDTIKRGVMEQSLHEALQWLLSKIELVAVAGLIIIIGIKLVKLFIKLIKKSLEKTNLNLAVVGFVLSLIRIILYICVFFFAAGTVGFQVTSVATLLGTTGLTLGLAFQGSLSNFAGGVLILINKPFKIGDYIIENVNKCEGTVVEIDIFYTKLRTFDNKIIVIPNGGLTNCSLINTTANEERQLDIKIGVSYKQNIGQVKDILKNIIETSEYYIKDREYKIFVDELADSSVKMGIRFWIKSDKYYDAKWATTEAIKIQFDKHGIEIPYNQLEVTLNNEK